MVKPAERCCHHTIPWDFATTPLNEFLFGTDSANQFQDSQERRNVMLLVLILLLLLLGGGGGYYGYSRWGAGGGIGIFGLILIVLLVYYLVAGTAPIRP